MKKDRPIRDTGFSSRQREFDSPWGHLVCVGQVVRKLKPDAENVQNRGDKLLRTSSGHLVCAPIAPTPQTPNHLRIARLNNAEAQMGHRWDGEIKKFFRLNRVRAAERQCRFNRGVIRAFVESRGPVPFVIAPRQIRCYLADLIDARRSPKTVRNHHAALSAFCGYLVGEEFMENNPCHSVALPPLEEQPPLCLDDAEYVMALAVARREGLFAEVALALGTGLRCGELRRLEWRDVELDRKALLVRKSKSKRPRTVWLNKLARLALRYQRRKLMACDCSHVFPGGRMWKSGGPDHQMRGENWWKRDALKPLQEAIPRFSKLPKGSTGRGWHLLRHTFASRLVRHGVSLYKVSKMLGHTSTKMTMRYAHLSGEFDPDIEKA